MGERYYPFVCTTIRQSSDLDYANLFCGETKSLISYGHSD